MDDIEIFLDRIFQSEPVSKQPRYIVELDCTDAARLKRAYQHIQTRTLRGTRLDDFPLTVIACYKDERDHSKRKKELEGIPHKLLHVANKKAADKALEDVARLSLFFDFSDASASDFAQLETLHGILRPAKSSSLLEFANHGFFPKPGKILDSLIHFEKRPYTAKLANGLLFQQGGKEIGSCRYLRIKGYNLLTTVEAVTALEDPHGPVLHITHFAAKQYEEELLQFVLQYAFSLPDSTYVTEAVSCQNYPGSDIISMESYVEELRQEKGSADLATKLHVASGAKIVSCLPNFRPEDKKNLGYAVLVAYTRESLTEAPLQLGFYTTECTKESIQHLVTTLITSLCGTYSSDKTVSEMGLSDVQQVELRASLADELELDLPSNFFTLYPTGERIIHALIESKLKLFHDWLYEIKWQSTAKPDLISLTPNNSWHIAGENSSELSISLQEHLHTYSQRCTTLEAANNIVYIQLEPTPLEESVMALVDLVNCAARLNKECSLWVVTNYIAEDAAVEALNQWPLNALCKVIREEYPKLQCRFVSIDPLLSPQDNAELLFTELRAATDASDVAFRRGERLTPKLVRLQMHAVKKPQFSPKATYLIAGGFRTLGILLARWYIGHGAKNIILLDELEESPEAKSLRATAVKAGVTIHCCKAQLDSEQQIKESLDQAFEKMPRLKGVIHAVGMVDNDLLIHMNHERFKALHRLKASLGLILHKYTETVDLDHFILFSSCLADISALGKANHATANSFLDALAHYRYKRGLPALVINWGPWELGHMQVRHIAEASRTDQVRTLRIEKGLELLDHLFSVAKPQVWAALINWPLIVQKVGETCSFFDEIAYELGLKRMTFINCYLTTEPSERQQELQKYLHERIRILLQLPSSQILEIGRDLRKEGLDANKMILLNKIIQRDLEGIVQLPLSFVEDNPSIQKLAHALEKALETVAPGGLKGRVLSEQLIQELASRLKSHKQLPKIIILEGT